MVAWNNGSYTHESIEVKDIIGLDPIGDIRSVLETYREDREKGGESPVARIERKAEWNLLDILAIDVPAA